MTVNYDSNGKEEPDIPIAMDAVPLANDDAASSPQEQAIKQPAAQRTVDVIAPSDLPGGYQFFVDAGGSKSVLVQVPAGGVRAAQRFSATVLEEVDRGSHNIPLGKWR